MQYLKIPSKTYKRSELERLEQQDPDEDEVEKLVRNALKKGVERKELSAVITWVRIPLEDFIGCTYESACSSETMDEEFDSGEFRQSVITFKDGIQMPCIWSVSKLEDVLIDNGIVHKSIKDQEEFYKL